MSGFKTTCLGNMQVVLILSCKMRTQSVLMQLGQLFGARLALWILVTAGTSI